MKKLIIQYAIKWILAPLNKIQQTHPKIYAPICAFLLASQVVINRPEVLSAIREACSCEANGIKNASAYLAISIASIMGSKKITTKRPNGTL